MLWVCTVCGYLHDEEDERPDICPVCGATGDRFRETAGDDSDLDSDQLGQGDGLDDDLDDDA